MPPEAARSLGVLFGVVGLDERLIAASQDCRNPWPRSSTQPLKSASPIWLGQLNAGLFGSRIDTGEFSSTTFCEF